VPFLNNSDYNKMSGFAAPRRIVGIARGSNAGGPIESSPLALCDARSPGTEHIVPIDLIYREGVGEIYGFCTTRSIVGITFRGWNVANQSY
jgi:hypothetical protein